MRALPILPVVIVIVCAAQSVHPPPPQTAGLLRGVLIERGVQARGGEFSIRTAGNEVVRYQFDARTYVERENRLVDIPRLQVGDQVEVISDQLAGMPLRYARTVHVIPPAPPKRPLTQGRYRAYQPDEDRVFPKGDLTFSGVTAAVEDQRLVLHQRAGADQTILLLPETRYMENGGSVRASDLKPNTRVFIRAGKNLEGRVEAYQVVWGAILDPRAPSK